MTDQPFTHLHVHTEFSLLDGLSKISRLVDRARNLGMASLAITDHGTMFGVMDFYNACKKADIKPLIGMESYLARRSMQDRDPKLDSKAFHLLLLARNEQGYRNLLKIASAAQLEGYYYRPRVDREFLAAHADGLIATSGCLAAEIPSMIMEGRDDAAREQIDWYQQVFGKENFFLELQHHDIEELRTVNNWLIEIGKRDDVRFVATNDVHYILDTDYDAHDTLLCIQTSAQKSEANRMRMTDNSYFLTSAAQMWDLFGHINDGEALLNTQLIAEMCDLNLDRKGYHLPIFPVPPGFDSATYLRHLCEVGLRWRYGENPAAYLRERLDYELQTIHNMGFDTYFLIVWDLCEYARERDIWWNVRGSGAGSMAAYCLGITNIDPIQNNLLFERFLNPGRVSMPDIDIDYPEDRRAEMIGYAARKYGEEKVAAIITFGTLGAKAAVRDVGRALGLPLEIVNQAARLIPTEPKPKPLMEYVEGNPDLRKLYDSDPEIQRVINTARELQGVSRHASTHAAGIIVGDKPLVEYIPLHRQTKEGEDSAIKQVTQFPMETCEAIGLLKIDFLGLSTLTILRKACDLIARHHGIHYTMDNIPYRPGENPEHNRMLEQTFELIGRGDTIGIFQVESSGMQQMLRGMRPTKFEHIVAGIALYRPGPMDYIPTYNNRMHGKETVEYHHEKLQDILGETFGIFVYQEQIMQVAGQMFGYSLGDADLMRRAVSKKKKEDLLKHRETFLKNGPTYGVSEEASGKIFDDIEFFANYGFNKSHAADYGVITVQTAFLKTHYPHEYMTALLSVYYDDAAKVTTFLGECKRMNIPILPPDVNYSELDFSVQHQDDGARGIRFGLAAIKNAGAGALQHILDARNAGGIFADLEDFCTRVDLRLVGKRPLESLIKVGAMSSLGTRPQLLNALDRMMSHSASLYRAKEVGQMNMFGGATGVMGDDMLQRLPPGDEASPREMLNWEKELLGLYVSSHPIDPAMELLHNARLDYTHELKEATPEQQDQPVKVVALIASLRKIPTRNMDMMGVAQLEDRYGTIEAVLFPRTWRQYEDLMNEGAVVFLSGKLDVSRGDPQIICEHVTQSFDTIVADGLTSMMEETLPVWMEETVPPGDNGHDDGRRNGNGNGNGNGHYAPGAQYTAASVEPPSLDEVPLAWMTDDTVLYDEPPAEEEKTSEARWLRIRFVRSDNADRDRRRLKTLYNTLTSYPGRDRFTIFLQATEGIYEFEFPNAFTGYCRELEQTLGEMEYIEVEITVNDV